VNEKIRVPSVRLINENGDQVGIVSTEKALEMAREVDMDLVEVAPDATPPVCRIMDYGKFKYRQKKRSHQKSHSRQQMKMLRVRPKTEEHDIQVKLRKAREFIEKGHRVQIVVQFRGREMQYREYGTRQLTRFMTELEDIAKVEAEPKMEGRRIEMTFAPK
jgi:translation initiation factor IF-3